MELSVVTRSSGVDGSVRVTNNKIDRAEEAAILRDDLKFYFMSPCEKYNARKQIPWKLGVQILKIIIITLQLVLFGLRNQTVVSYKEETTITFKQLFIKSYTGSSEDEKSHSIYTQKDVYDSMNFVVHQYMQFKNLSVGAISYSQDTSEFEGLEMCRTQYKEVTSTDTFHINPEMETNCLKVNSSYLNNDWKLVNESLLGLDFYRLIDVIITFKLKGINLQAIRSLEIPDCYDFYVTITFDNQGHSGLLKVFLNNDAIISECNNWNISASWPNSKYFLLVFDSFVILVCFISAVLCIRSIILARRLLQRFVKFFQDHYERTVCESDKNEFINMWYILIIISDLMAIIGLVLKMEIQTKNLASYDCCSILLGTSTLMVWVGVIRYLGYFQKYNVLILTMNAALPKVLRFCCCAGMIYLGYMFCGWIVLGPYHKKFETLSTVAECLFSLVNGDDMFATFAQIQQKSILVWLFSRVYLYTFIALFIYMVLSLFIALITDSYETIKKYQAEGFPVTDLERFLKECEDFPHLEKEEESNVSFLCCKRSIYETTVLGF